MITIEGTLAFHAEYRTTGVSDAVVVLMVDPGVGSELFQVAVPFGRTPEAHLQAQAAAGVHRAGATVKVRCCGLRWCSDHGVARFIVRLLISAHVGSHLVYSNA